MQSKFFYAQPLFILVLLSFSLGTAKAAQPQVAVASDQDHDLGAVPVQNTPTAEQAVERFIPLCIEAGIPAADLAGESNVSVELLVSTLAAQQEARRNSLSYALKALEKCSPELRDNLIARLRISSAQCGLLDQVNLAYPNNASASGIASSN